MASLENARALAWEIRLVILRKLYCLASLANDTACVARVAAVDMSRRDENNIGSATCLVSIVLAWYIVRVLTADALKLFATIWCEQHFVHANERVYECLLIVLASEVLVIFELFHEMVPAEFRYFSTTMAIEDSKK